MPKLEYFLVAESVSVDQTTNRISIFHILEEIHVAKFPFALPLLAAVAQWNAEDGDVDRDFQVGLVIKPPDGQPKEFSQNFRMIHPRLRTIMNLVGLPLTQPGTMTVEIKLNGDHKAYHTTDIRKIES